MCKSILVFRIICDTILLGRKAYKPYWFGKGGKNHEETL